MDDRARALDLSLALRGVVLGGLPTWLVGAVVTCIANLELCAEDESRWTSVALHGLFAQAETLINVCAEYRASMKKRDSA